MWVSVAEASKLLNKSVITIQRQAKSGKLMSRLVSGHGGDGQLYEVCISDKIPTNDNYQ